MKNTFSGNDCILGVLLSLVLVVMVGCGGSGSGSDPVVSNEGLVSKITFSVQLRDLQLSKAADDTPVIATGLPLTSKIFIFE